MPCLSQKLGLPAPPKPHLLGKSSFSAAVASPRKQQAPVPRGEFSLWERRRSLNRPSTTCVSGGRLPVSNRGRTARLKADLLPQWNPVFLSPRITAGLAGSVELYRPRVFSSLCLWLAKAG